MEWELPFDHSAQHSNMLASATTSGHFEIFGNFVVSDPIPETFSFNLPAGLLPS
jgi:hypothetical protein